MKLRISGQFWRPFMLERVHRLFALIIVTQLIQCFSDYWWEETYSIIYGTLAVMAVTELLMTRMLGLRLTLQLIAMLGFAAWIIPVEWGGWPASWRVWEQVNGFVTFHAEQFHPFAMIAIGVLLAVHVLSWIGTSRAGAITVTMMSITTMAIVDSFYPLELWQHIAWIVTVGLAWLVILHLRQLQIRYPDSWEALAERPLDIAFPAIVIITLVLLTGVMMPRAPVILDDPYTLWTEAKGREVPVFAGEGGGQRGSPVGNQGSSLSGYSRDDRAIGGGFQFDYSPVMTITTTQRSYWRGETKSIYTGKGWSDSKTSQLVQAGIGNQAGELEPDPPFGEGVETIDVVQTATIVRKDKLPVLFAASPVSSISDLKSDNNAGLLWNPEEWELGWSKSAQVESYSLISRVAVLDEDALRALRQDGEYRLDVAPYLQLPDTVPERVRNLAQEQTSGLTNDYDRAKKLEQYLKETFPYTNTPDLSRRTARTKDDFVDAFLFEVQEGYCDYFSTAFVVMARSIGLPTRWVKGYSTGYDASLLERINFGVPSESVNPSGAGTYTVRNADAHSWAEVYFEGYGWIPFEPTSGFSVPQPLPLGEVVAVNPEIDTAVSPVEPTIEEQPSNWLMPVAVTGVVLILAVLVWFAYRSSKTKRLWHRIRYRGNTPNQRVVREMERLLSFLHRKGLRREMHETIRESFVRWGGTFGSIRGEFDEAVVVFEKARYGRDKGSSQLLHDFNEISAKIRKAL